MARLKFISTGSTTVTLNAVGTPFLTYFFVRKNDSDISQSYTMGSGITLSDGEQISFFNTQRNLSKDGSNYYQFVITGDGTVEVEGDLVSLIYNTAAVKQYQFINLFRNCTKITSISGLNFPDSIADFCYSNMFAGCTGLVNAGTTLPATAVSRWCYNGMFVDCSSMTTPPTILAEKVAPFSYYQMFAGCTSLTNGPQLYNTVVEGKMNSNCMFKGCSNLSSIHVSFTSWPAEADQNESRNWLSGVAQNGLFVYPTTLTIPTGVVPNTWTLSSTYPATIVVSDMTIDFDAMLDQVQLSSLAYGYVGGTETVNIAIDDTNKPAWLSSTIDSDSVDFSANGYSINTNASFILPITFSAADAATKNVNVTFNVLNYPTATITVSTIPTFTFDADSETDIVSSLMTYATGSNSISCQIEGELPAGLSCVDGIITGVPADFTGNYSGSFDIIYSASDARNVSSSFNLEIINAAPDYSTIPLTLSADASTTISFQKNNSPTAVVLAYNKNNTGWQSYTIGTGIDMVSGDTVAFSGNNSTFNGWILGSDWNSYYKLSSSTNDCLALYGNIDSLVNFDASRSNIYFSYLFNNCYGIKDAANLIIPHAQNNSMYSETFAGCSRLINGPQLRETSIGPYAYYNMFNNAFRITNIKIDATDVTSDWCCRNMFTSCSALSSIEVNFSSYSNSSNQFSNWVKGVAANGTFTKPANTYIPEGTAGIPSGWTVVNK